MLCCAVLVCVTDSLVRFVPGWFVGSLVRSSRLVGSFVRSSRFCLLVHSLARLAAACRMSRVKYMGDTNRLHACPYTSCICIQFEEREEER